MTKSESIFSEARDLERRAEEKREQARIARMEELRAQPLLERLTFAATARCACGAGFAYGPAAPDDPKSVFRGATKWECSDILRYQTLDPERQWQDDAPAA